MPRFPVGNLTDINLPEKHGWNLGGSYLWQDLDTTFSGSAETPNPLGRRNVQQTLMLYSEFGLDERLSLRGSVPVRNIDSEGVVNEETTGLGDVELILRHSTVQMDLQRKIGLNLIAGLGLPTGRSEGLTFAMENIQFGVGDFTAIAGFELSYRLRPLVTTYLRSQARFVLGSNSDGYQFGDALYSTAGAAFRIGSTENQVLTQITALHLDQDRQDGVLVPSRGGRWIYGSAGFRFAAGRRGGVTATVQHLLDTDLRGDQLVSPWNFIVGFDIRLPGHRHPAGENPPPAQAGDRRE